MNPRTLPRRLLALTLATLALSLPPLRAVEPAGLHAGARALGVPDWVRSSVIYEVNVRQYSAAGTFAAVQADLPRLQALGVDILWFMPIHPIGAVNRKGSLGSYYAVQDYFGVNPEFGTADDFRALVREAHARGFRVVLDWVGNHTAWDNPLAREHPDHYLRDHAGKFQPPTGFDWTDVIQLDFTPAVLDYQARALLHWVQDFGVDGFRCDYATGVPTPFWDQLTARVRAARPDVFFLSESELPQHQLRAFHTSYGFDFHQTMNAVAQGRKAVSALDDSLARTRVQFPAGGSLMFFTSSHDENSWAGTEFERLGGGAAPFAVLTFILDGVPMIYNGQETGLDRRLAFFERDPIVWPAAEHPLTGFYRTLTGLRRTHPALRTGASMRRLDTTKNDSLYALLREAGGAKVAAFLNLTARDVQGDAYDPALAGRWRDAFTGEVVTLGAHAPLELQAWRYRVLVSAE